MQIITVSRRSPLLPPPLYEVLPLNLCNAIELHTQNTIEEIRLHSDRVTTLTSCGKNISTGVILSEGEIQDILQRMCGGSLYAFSSSICNGFLCMEGGIRVGICGCAAVENGQVIGVNSVSGLIIRIPHKVSVDAFPIIEHLRSAERLRGILIYAPPGVGKTTLLRAVAKLAASPKYGIRTVLVDTREELRYTLEGSDLTLDVLVGYPKEIGIEIAVRSLGAQLIICDEIGNEKDARAILSAANCGVPLVASAHAKEVSELISRPTIQMLHRARVFDCYAGLHREGTRFQYSFTSHEEADQYLKGV